MIISKQLSPYMAVQLTESVDDWHKVEKSNLSEWFKGVYAVCLLWLKPDIYQKCRPDINIEAARREIIEAEKKRKAIEDRFKTGRFSR